MRSLEGVVPKHDGTSEQIEGVVAETIYESLRINFTKMQYKSI